MIGGMRIRLLPESVIDEAPNWTLAVNRNQNLLGKVMLVARRPVSSVVDLRAEEWLELRHEIGRLCAALDALFQPDQYNHAFLMNVDAEVHLHVVPRYRHDRQWSGEVFSDPHYGGLFGTEERVLELEKVADLSVAVRGRLPHLRIP
jgi:diadenosine tetraphosphate (Ap4A) HIT family hydrolase